MGVISDEKKREKLRGLKEAVDAIGGKNEEVDLEAGLGEVRRRYRLVCSLLRIRPRVVGSSASESL